MPVLCAGKSCGSAPEAEFAAGFALRRDDLCRLSSAPVYAWEAPPIVLMIRVCWKWLSQLAGAATLRVTGTGFLKRSRTGQCSSTASASC
jgi:hypothetical protein